MLTLVRWSAGIVLVALAGSASGAADGKVRRDGFDLHYTVVGDQGPYLVILAGGPGFDPGYMKPVADELGKTHRCILLEQRGTGRSKLTDYTPQTVNFPAYLADLEAVREHLREEKLTLVGNSWGMLLALTYAGAHPDRTRAVVSLGSGVTSARHQRAVRDNFGARLSEAEEKAVAEVGKKYASDPDRAALEQMRATSRAWFVDRNLARTFWAGLPDGSLNSKVAKLVMEGPLLDRFVGGVFGRITAPVLLVHGRQDAVAEGEIFEASHQIKNARLVLLERCGHFPWLEQPGQTWKAVRAFLGGLDGAK